MDENSFEFRREQLLETIRGNSDRMRRELAARDTQQMNNNYRIAQAVHELTEYGESHRYIKRADGLYYGQGSPVRKEELPFSHEKFAISAEGKRLIEYEDPKTNRVKSLKPAGFIKLLNKQLELGFDDQDVDIYATYLGEDMPNETEYIYEIVGGKEIKKLYEQTPRTCMTGSSTIDWYAANDPNIRAIRIMRRGKVFGRAVLWALHDGRHYIDRIYPSSGSHILELIAYGKKQNWVSRPTHGAEIPADKREDMNDIVTVPLVPPNDDVRSAHSMGGFPYQDTFRYMKHSPDKEAVMLRPLYQRGWVGVGEARHAYRNLKYCPLLRGWTDSTIKAHLLTENLEILPEAEYDGPTIRRLYRLVRIPKRAAPAPGIFRVFAPETMAEHIVTDPMGTPFLKKHSVQTTQGDYVFVDDALEMHDGTYVHALGQLRYVARLANGKFIFRRDAYYDQETKQWFPKGGTRAQAQQEQE